MTQESLPQPEATGAEATRRAVLAGASLVGVTALAACSTSSTASGGTPSANTASGSPAGGANPGGPPMTAGGSPTTGGTGAGSGAGGGTVLGAATTIPVGSGKVFTAEKVVVTQPTAGHYRGFSAVCTHMHCIVDRVANGTIDCPCHGSRYSISDGSVVAGPAPSPLPPQPITVSGGKITLG
ncbi:MAG TPA: Rieske (2Fe-2S) protein [Streptosporangiaceae bacterium]